MAEKLDTRTEGQFLADGSSRQPGASPEPHYLVKRNDTPPMIGWYFQLVGSDGKVVYESNVYVQESTPGGDRGIDFCHDGGQRELAAKLKRQKIK